MLGTVAQLCEESSPGSCKSSRTDCSQPSQLRAKPWHQHEGEYSPPECLLQLRQQMGLLKRGWMRPALLPLLQAPEGKLSEEDSRWTRYIKKCFSQGRFSELCLQPGPFGGTSLKRSKKRRDAAARRLQVPGQRWL